jgi:hypothetical protein
MRKMIISCCADVFMNVNARKGMTKEMKIIPGALAALYTKEGSRQITKG